MLPCFLPARPRQTGRDPMHPEKTVRATFIVLCALFGAINLYAQNTGRIEGTVKNAAEIAATDASVQLVGLARLVDADERGMFVFEDVPAGVYVVAATSERWGRVVEPIMVAAGETTSVTLVILRHIEHEEVVITAGPIPLTRSDAVQPTTVLTKDELSNAGGVTIGEAIGDRPGISSTYFGPGASRPVIRGLGGNRVQVLQQGLSVADASDVSPDHAVAIETLTSERVEILRGPATLLYGSSAIGGVVNVLDGRVPNELPTKVLRGSVTARGGTVAKEKTGAVELRGAIGRVAWRTSGLWRNTEDYTIPGAAALDNSHEEEEEEDHEGDEDSDDEDHHDEDDEDDDPDMDNSGGEEDSGILEGSALQAMNGSMGISYIGNRGYFGASFTRFDSEYGVPGHAHGEDEGGEHDDEENGEAEEAGTRVDMRQNAVNLEGAWRFTNAYLSGLRIRMAQSDYLHDELEGAVVGTTFDNDQWTARLEADHSLFARSTGVVGLQLGKRNLTVTGEEAYIPRTTTTNTALFLLERFQKGNFALEAGARVERVRIVPQAQGHDRTFTGISASAGVNYRHTPNITFAFSASRSVKIPDATELYSNGPHAATRAFEIGDANLDAETATSLDISTHVHFDRLDATATLFANRFSDYIFLQNTNRVSDGFLVYQVTQGDAIFRGIEAEADVELFHAGEQHVTFRVWGDYTHAGLIRNNEPLPRIPPVRIGGGLRYVWDKFRANVSIEGVGRQTRIAAYEQETPGYALVHATASYRFITRQTVHILALTGRNLTDATARKHTSFLKDLAPLPGRDLRLTYTLLF